MHYFHTFIAALLLAAPALASPYPVPSPAYTEPLLKAPYAAEPLVDHVVPVKTPCPHSKKAPFAPEISPEPVVDPIYTPPAVESPEPVVDPIFTPVESPEPVVDPIYTPPVVESPEPVVDPIYTPPVVESPEPVVDPVYTPPVESPEPVVDPVYPHVPVKSPVPHEHPVYSPEDDADDYLDEGDDEYDDGDDGEKVWEKDMEKWDDADDVYTDDVYTPPVYSTPAPVPHKKPTHGKPVKEDKEVGHCYLQSVDFGKYTAEQCCQVRYGCDSPHCAHNYACKHNPDVCHCHKVVCKKIYLLASYKPVHKIHPSCSGDVFALH